MSRQVFDKSPNFAELWDICLSKLYNREAYVLEVLELLGAEGISKSSQILDSCAGTGFISLDLRKLGLKLDCMDLMDDEIEVFRKNANAVGVDSSIKKLSWKDIPQNYSSGTYDFLFCRGNSFIYADGGWNETNCVGKESSLISYEETLRIFYDVLARGGTLYIDKFLDEEQSHHNIISKINICGREEDLIYHTERMVSANTRRATLVRRQGGEEISVPNITYDLKESELEQLMQEVGFRNIRKVKLKSEKNLVVWLAEK